MKHESGGMNDERFSRTWPDNERSDTTRRKGPTMFAMLMGLKGISPQELHPLLGQQDLTVVDVNARQSWAQARVPGAVNLPVEFEADMLPRETGGLLVFYCSNPLCRKAPRAARRARQLGYANVRVMSAGISGWLGARLPVDSGV
jgi:rhodanese-related sulfurtransferase